MGGMNVNDGIYKSSVDPSSIQAPPPPPPPPKKDPEQAAHDAHASIPELRTTTLYVSGISPGDIHQGEVKDCTLQASLASLARTPEGCAVIRRALEELKDPSGKPFYRVTLYDKDAGLRPVKIDIREGELKISGPLHSLDPKTDRIECWSQVIEAATLKLRNGKPVADTLEAFSVLTGGQATASPTSDRSFEDRLFMGFQTKKVQVLVTTGAFFGNVSDPNLKPDHAYTVVGVTRYLGQTLVQLRNPWGFDQPRPMSLDEVKKYCPVYTEGALP